MDSKQQNKINKIAKVIYKLALREKYVSKLNKKLLLLDSIDNNLISHLHKEFPFTLYGGTDYDGTGDIKEINIGEVIIPATLILTKLIDVYDTLYASATGIINISDTQLADKYNSLYI